MPLFYVDPSLIAGIILGDMEEGAPASILRDVTTLAYSDFGLGEVISAISARIRIRRASDEVGAVKIAQARQYLERWHCVSTLASDLLQATEFVALPSLALKFPDAIHIAIAQRLKLPLLTHDRQQHTAAIMLGLTATSTLQPR